MFTTKKNFLKIVKRASWQGITLITFAEALKKAKEQGFKI